MTLTRTTRELQLRIHERGTTTPADGTVEWTFAQSRIVTVPPFGGQVVQITEGRAEQAPYWIEIQDVDGEFTATLATSGRMWLLGRILELRLATDGGSFATVDTRRLSRVEDGPAGQYRLEASDERWLESKAPIFARTTSWQLDPPGPTAAFMGRAAANTRSYRLIPLTASLVWLYREPAIEVSQTMVEVLRDDLLEERDATVGSFRELRCAVGGGDRLVYAFDDGTADNPLGNRLGSFWGDPPQFAKVALIWPSHGYTEETVVTGKLYWPGGIPTTEATPYLIGGLSTGKRPDDLWQEILDGDHGGPVQRYDSSAFTTLAGETYPAPWWKITGPKQRNTWIEDNLARPWSLFPFVNATGEIAPRSLRPLENVDPDTLYEFDLATVTEGPRWRHPGREAITALTFKAQRRIYAVGFPLPGVATAWEPPTEEADTVDDLGRREITIATEAIFKQADGAGVLAGLVRDVFDRFQDGPQLGELAGPIDASAPVPGDFVVLDHGELRGPNPATGDRTGLRIVQIVDRRRLYASGRAEYHYAYLDAGPKAQPLATPSVSVALNGTTPKHAVDVTVSSVAAGATAILEVAHGASPSASDWIVARTGVGNETVTIPQRPSGTQINVRARATAPNSVRSAWSTVDDVTTTALTAPAAVVATVDGRSVTIDVTPGETTYPIEFTVDGTVVRQRPAGTTREVLHGRPASTSETYGARYFDVYGGVSSLVTDTQTTGTASTAPAMVGLTATPILFEGEDGDPILPSEDGGELEPLEPGAVVVVLRPIAGDRAFPIRIVRAPGADGSPELEASELTNSGLGSFDADAAIDGSTTGTAWSTDAASSGATLTIDLGASDGDRAYHTCRLYLDAGSGAATYAIEYSDNGSSWSAAVSSWTPNAAGWNEVRWADVGAHRYWRLRLTNTPGAGPEVTELELRDDALVATVPGTTRLVQDPRPHDAGRWWYRARHAREGWLDGTPTDWILADLDAIDRGDPDPPAVGDDDITRIRRTTPFDDGKHAAKGEADGNIADGVQIYDGVHPNAIGRHVEAPQWAQDGDSIVFGRAYQNAPLLVLAGLKVQTYKASWTDEYLLRVYPTNVSASGFDVVAKNVQPGTITQREDDFPTTNELDAAGETTELTLGNAPSNDDGYVAHYDVEVNAQASEGGKGVTVTVVVAVDTDTPGTGSWVERATQSYAVFMAGFTGPDPGPETETWAHEQKAISVGSLTTSSKVRVRVKSITITGDGSGTVAVHGFNKATDGDAAAGVTYTTATDTVETATPNDEDGVLFAPIEIA